MLVNANIDGVLNIANITKAYPIELDNVRTGILKAKLNTVFDINAIEFGNGLNNMQTRITEINGKLNIDSTPKKGTKIQFSIPKNTHNDV